MKSSLNSKLGLFAVINKNWDFDEDFHQYLPNSKIYKKYIGISKKKIIEQIYKDYSSVTIDCYIKFNNPKINVCIFDNIWKFEEVILTQYEFI